MADDRDVARRIRAYLAGHPLPLLEFLPISISPPGRRMLVSFVRMGGESSPWGIGWQIGDAEPRLIGVAEPRNRTLVAEMVAEFGDALCTHFEVAFETDEEPDAEAVSRYKEEPPPQLWVGGGTDLEMLHFLALRYCHAKHGDSDLRKRLQRIGRLCLTLFESARNPNRSICVPSGDLLRRLLVFPCEPIRTMHLGYMLAMIDPGTLHERLARAEKSEQEAASTSLDPALERALEPVVEQWHKGNAAEKTAAEQTLSTAIGDELRRRLNLVRNSIRVTEGIGLEVNPGAYQIAGRSLEGLKEHWRYDKWATDMGPGRSAETDHDPHAAAEAFALRDADELEARADLLMHDSLLQQDAIRSGEAIRGRIADRRTATLKSHTKRVRLVVETDNQGPLALRAGDRLRSPEDSDPQMRWAIESIELVASGCRRITLTASHRLADDAAPLAGATEVFFFEAPEPDMRRRLARMIDEASATDDLPSTRIFAQMGRSRRDRENDAAEDAFPTDLPDTSTSLGLSDEQA